MIAVKKKTSMCCSFCLCLCLETCDEGNVQTKVWYCAWLLFQLNSCVFHISKCLMFQIIDLTELAPTLKRASL